MPDFEQIGVQAVVAGMAQFRADAAAYTRNILDMTGVTKVSAGAVDALGQVAIGAEREIGRLAVSFVRIANQELIRFIEGLVSAGAAGTTFVSATKTLQDHLDGIARVQLNPLFEQLGQLVTKASPAIEAFTQFALGAFDNLAQGALSWGENVVNQFAQGMWNAVGAVIQSLTNIANLVAYFLAPGSPPRLLPDIDDWGKGAMQAYLDGWGKANFSIFNELAGTIEGYIKSLSANASDTGLIPRILGAREAIAEAVDQARQTGVVTVDSLNKIYTAAGATTASMQAYVKSVFNLELANAQVTKAQDDLNKVTAEYDALLKPVTDKLGQVSEAQKQLSEDSEISQLKLVAADPNATAAEKRQAQLEIERILTERQQRALVASKGAAVDAAQAKLDASKKGADAAQDQFDTQKALMALQTQQNELIKQQIQLLERLNKASGGGAGGPKPGGGGGGGVVPKFSAGGFDLSKLIPPDIKAKLGELVSAFEDAFKAIAAKFQPTIDAINNLLLPAIGRLVKAFQDSWPKIEAVIADLLAFGVIVFGAILPIVINNLAESVDTLTKFWQRHGDTVLAIIDFLGRVIIVTLAGAVLLASAIIDIALRSIEGFFDLASALIRGNWKEAWDTIVLTVSQNVLTLLGAIQAFLTQVASIVGLDLGQIQATWAADWELINIAVSTVLTAMSTAINTWLTTASTAIGAWITQVQTDWNTFWAAVQTKVEAVTEAVRLAIDTKIAAGKKIITDATAALKTDWTTFWTDVQTKVENVVEAVRAAIDDKIHAAQTILETVMGALVATIQGPITAFNNLLGAAQAVWDFISTHVFGIPGSGSSTSSTSAYGGSATSVAAPAVSAAYSYANTSNYNLNVSSSREAQSLSTEFAIMQVLAGAPA